VRKYYSFKRRIVAALRACSKHVKLMKILEQQQQQQQQQQTIKARVFL